MEKTLQTLNSDHNIQLWTERIRECRCSGQNVRDWCRENNLSHNAYYYWQKKIFDLMKSQEPRFAEIPITAINKALPIAKTSVNGIELDFYSGITSDQVATLVAGLKQC